MHMKLITAAAAAATVLLLPTVGQAATYTDNAGNAVYASGYAGVGGTVPGYGNYSVTAVNGNNVAPFSGTFVGDASNSEGDSGTPTPGSINTGNTTGDKGGKAFGFYANGSATAAVTINRLFTQGPQSIGDSFSLDLVPGYNDSGTTGVSLVTSSGDPGSFVYSGTTGAYSFNGTPIASQSFSAGAIHLAYTLTSPTAYSFVTTGAVAFTGSGTLTSPITGFQVAQTNSGSGSGDHDGYFNNLSLTTTAPAVPEASSTVSLGLFLALGLGGLAIARKHKAVSAK